MPALLISSVTSRAASDSRWIGHVEFHRHDARQRHAGRIARARIDLARASFERLSRELEAKPAVRARHQNNRTFDFHDASFPGVDRWRAGSPGARNRVKTIG